MIRAVPSGGVTLQLGTTTSGTNDLVTGAAAGTSAGEFDVDGGSDDHPVTGDHAALLGTLTLTFSWYLAHLNNSSSADFFRCSVVAGAKRRPPSSNSVRPPTAPARGRQPQ